MTTRNSESKKWHLLLRKQVLAQVAEFARDCYARGLGNARDAERRPVFYPEVDDRRNQYRFTITGETFTLYIHVAQQTRVGLVSVHLHPARDPELWRRHGDVNTMEIDTSEIRLVATIFPDVLPEFLERAPALVQLRVDSER